MNLTLTIVHKTKKTNKLYYTGDDPVLTDPPLPIAQVLGAAVTEGYRIRVRILRTMLLTCTPTNPKNPLHCSSLACYVIGLLPWWTSSTSLIMEIQKRTTEFIAVLSRPMQKFIANFSLQPSKLKFLLGCHLATNSFGLGRLFYQASRQLQNFRCHGNQMVATWRVALVKVLKWWSWKKWY